MNKTLRKAFVIVSICCVVLIALYVSLTVFITHKIKNGLTNLPDHIQLGYKNIEIDLLSASAELDSVSIKLNSTDLSTKLFSATLKTIQIEGVSYRDIIFKRKLSINNLKMEAPNVVQFSSKVEKLKDESKVKSNDSKKPTKIFLNQLSITNGSFKQYDSLKKEKLSAKSVEIFFNEVNYNAEKHKKSIPFNFKSFSINGQSLMAKTGAYETLNVKTFKITDQTVQFRDGVYQTKYSRNELSKHIKKEKDHFVVLFDEVQTDNYNIKELESGFLDIKISLLNLNNVNATIYRNKLLPDDFTHKKLYSEQLRELKHHLKIDLIKIKNSEITYAEKVKVGAKPGELYFKNLNATIANLGNNYNEDKEVDINVTATFMNQTNLKVDWSFNVNNSHDRFLFKAAFNKLPAEDLNPFVTPNLSIGLEGVLEETYFTIGGNKHIGAIDFRTRYDNFKVDIFDRETRKKKKFLSGLINLFIAKDSDKNTNGFRSARVEQVERDPTKSIFNFIWLNARSGLLKAMTSKGEKKD
tara:strand:+ start:82 stop:1656 length:1575 start_codon:yes stop_codon:yes gene_type:complete